MIEGLLSPPNVRTHKDYEDVDLSDAKEWLREDIEAFDNVVFMGVPGSEKKQFTETGQRILESELTEDAEVYAHEGVGEGLEEFDYEDISYSDSPSRIADIEWMNEEFSEDESVAVVSFDYNVRTGSELDGRMNSHDTFSQFALDFEDFQSFNITNYIKGFFPGTESFRDKVKDSEKGFDYETPDVDGEPVVVLNVAYSDSIDDYDEKMRSEALRDGLAKLPYGQEMKDLGKKGLDRVLGGFEY